MATEIHSSAVVHPGAEIGENVRIGPFCVIDDKVQIGDECQLDAYVRVHHHTIMGRGNRVQAYSALGGDPEDLKYDGEESWLVIGNNNDMREHVTMNRGTAGGGYYTRIGNDCLFQNKVHIGHDCQIGNQVIISAMSALAGHAEMEDRSLIGGAGILHQFVRIGTGTMIGFGSVVERSVPPYCLYHGPTGRVMGPNIIGMRRRGFENATIRAVTGALNSVFDPDETLQNRMQSVIDRNAGAIPEVDNIADFVLNRSGKRGIVEGQVRGN